MTEDTKNADHQHAVGAPVQRPVGRPVPERTDDPETQLSELVQSLDARLSKYDDCAMPLKGSEVNHLRRLLAWMQCEWTLDEDMQRGCLNGAASLVAHGFATPEQAGALLTESAEKINRCPAYVRQAVKMLTKALRDHERNAGIVEVGGINDHG